MSTAYEHPDRINRRRRLALKLLDRGWLCIDIASWLGVSKHTVYRWKREARRAA